MLFRSVNWGVAKSNLALNAQGGYVGIGTSSPGYLLTVNGTASFVNQLAANNSPNVNSQGAWIGWNASGGNGETNFINQNGAGVGGFTWAQSTTGNSRTEWMRLTSSGALGINTTSVQGKFQVNQDTTVSAFNSVFRTLSSGSFLYDLIVGGDSTGPYIGPYQSYPLRFNTNNTEVMRLGTNGWLGVGTSSPIRQFHLNTGASSAIEMSLTTTSSSGTAYLDISDNAGNNGGNYNLYFRGLTSSGATQVNLNTINLYANNTLLNGALAFNNYNGILWPGGTYIYADSSGNGPGDFVVRTYNGSTYNYSIFYNYGDFQAPGAIYGNRLWTGWDSGWGSSISCSNWFRTLGVSGIYWSSYGRGLFPPDGTVSYGSVCVYGGGLNGWQGYSLTTDNSCILMCNGSGNNWGIYSPNYGYWLMIGDFGGNVTFHGNVTAYSDIRFKENIRPIDNVTERRNTLALSAIKYERDGRTRIGYGAQMLMENGCPEFVLEQDDSLKLVTGLGTLSVDYGETAAVLAVASKNTDDRVEALENRIAYLESVIQNFLENRK